MRFALIIAGKQSIQSFRCAEGRCYCMEPPFHEYFPLGGIRNVYNLPRPFDGKFIQWQTDEDLVGQYDVIFLVIDEQFGRYKVDTIRKKFPNAYVVAYLKERSPLRWLPQERIDVWKQCDAIALPYRTKVCKEIAQKVQIHIYSFPYPYNIEQIRNDKYITWDKRNNIMVVGPNWWNPLRGYKESITLAHKIEKDFKINVVDMQGKDYHWNQWLTLLAHCRYCLNLDPLPEVGQCPIECAILGVMYLGSNLDSAHQLWHITDSSINVDEVYRKFNMMFKDPGIRDFHLCGAYELVEKIYSFKAAQENLQFLLGKQ